MREHGIHGIRGNIARRKPLNLAADSREIIGSEGKRERERKSRRVREWTRYISVIFSTPTIVLLPQRPIKQAPGYHSRMADVFTILPVFTRR